MEPDVKVVRNDAYTVEEIEAMKPEAIILSPDPENRPTQEAVLRRSGILPESSGLWCVSGTSGNLRSICGTVSYAKELMHGKQKEIHQIGENQLFQGLPETFPAARYHSLAALKEKLPEELKVTAESEDGEVMAVEHTKYPIYCTVSPGIGDDTGWQDYDRELYACSQRRKKKMIKEAISKVAKKRRSDI